MTVNTTCLDVVHRSSTGRRNGYEYVCVLIDSERESTGGEGLEG